MPLPEATKILTARRVAADDRDDRTLAQEQVGQPDRLVEHAARVAAQVEDDAGEPAARLPLQLGQRFGNPRRRPVIEAVDPDHADIAVARCGYSRFEHQGALQLQLTRLGHADRHDPDRDRAADRSAQPVDDFAMHAPCVATPSIATIWSSGRMPARSAGLCGSTAVTRNVSFAPSTVIPIPPQPLRAARWSRARSGGAYREKRSRLRVIPSTTACSTVSVGSAASCGEPVWRRQ